MKLNIGYGKVWNLYPGYDGLDINNFGQTCVGEVFQRMTTMHENVYEEVMANHFIEHFNRDKIAELFKLVRKVLKPDGLFRIVVPSKDRDEAYCFTHQFLFSENTFRVLEDPVIELYGFDRWKIEELVTNEKKNIHCLLRVVK